MLTPNSIVSSAHAINRDLNINEIRNKKLGSLS